MRCGCGHRAARPRAGDVVCAQDRDRDRRADPPEAAPTVRRRRPLHRELRHRRSSSSCWSRRSCGSSHTLFLARLLFGRTIGWGAQARDDHEVPWSLAVATLLAADPDRARAAARCSPLTAPSAIPYALLHRRRSAALDPARGGDRRAGARARADRASASTGCRRRPCRRRNCARWSCPRSSCRSAAGEPAWRSAWYASWHESWRTRSRRPALAPPLLRRSRAPRGHGSALPPVRERRATSCSTSAPMSATASPSFAGSARAWWRSSRSLRWSGR